MSRTGRWGAAIILSLGLAAGAYWFLSGAWTSRPGNTETASSARPEPSDSAPVASVKTARLRTGTITEVITVYGSVVPAPGALQTISVPFECQVLKVPVNVGQRVSGGDILLEIEPSPDTSLRFQQARETYRLAEDTMKNTQHRYDLKLATNDQLLRAKEALEQAGLTLQSMKDRGIDGRRRIPSSVAGLVNRVFVQQGAIVPPGDRMIETVAQDMLEIRLGVEPEDTGSLRIGQPVSLSYVNVPASRAASGRVRDISQAVNPQTRLVDVFVSSASSAALLMGEYMVGRITISSARGFVVPRSAVLPEDAHYVLYTVHGGRAVKKIVEIGLQNDREIQVSAPSLNEGDEVVVIGNYVLRDGMPVKTDTGK